MKVAQILFIMGIFSFLFGGCKQPSDKSPQDESSPLKGSPEVTSESEEGFHDLVFYIEEHKTLSNGTQTIRCSGIYKGEKLGFDVILGSNWKAGSLSKDFPLVTYQGLVTYHSIGDASDSFLKTLDELYGTKLNPKGMRGDTEFTGITLGGDPRELAKEPVKIKLFYESGGEDDSAELYTNIDLAAHKLSVREKDEGYRKAVVKALAVQ